MLTAYMYNMCTLTDMIHVCTVCICDIFNNIIITCIKDMIHYVATYMCTCTRIVPCTVILYICGECKCKVVFEKNGKMLIFYLLRSRHTQMALFIP